MGFRFDGLGVQGFVGLGLRFDGLGVQGFVGFRV